MKHLKSIDVEQEENSLYQLPYDCPCFSRCTFSIRSQKMGTWPEKWIYSFRLLYTRNENKTEP
jgi:hypothetical protein